MKPWMHYAVGAVVFCHGFVYVRIGSMLPGAIKGWKGSSWLLGDTLGAGQLTTLIVSLHVIAGIATLACALAIAWPSLLPGWWRPLMMAAGVLGLASFAVFWDGQRGLALEEGAIGAAISVVLLIVAAVLPAAGR